MGSRQPGLGPCDASTLLKRSKETHSPEHSRSLDSPENPGCGAGLGCGSPLTACPRGFCLRIWNVLLLQWAAALRALGRGSGPLPSWGRAGRQHIHCK